MIIHIDGIDRTKKVKANSTKIENILTRRRDSCFFIVEENTGDPYVPAIGKEIIIYSDSTLTTKLFGGVITEIDSTPISFGTIQHKIRCQDYTRLLDRRLVPDTYENQTIDAIIADLKTQFMPNGFTINNVDANILIKYISFNYKPLSKVLEELANEVNYDWYVDYDKDIHFFAKDIVTAPFDIIDNDGSYMYNSLIIRKDNTQIRNSIIIRGGEYEASQLTIELEASGVDWVFPTQYKFRDFTASLTGQVLDIGDHATDPASEHDALHDINEKILIMPQGKAPTAGSIFKLAGKPLLPVIVKYKDNTAIQAMISAEGNIGSGIYEYLIEDKSINSKEGARQRAQAEILAYATTLTEGEFITETDGLVSGMKILINSSSRNINESYVINKVTTIQFGTTGHRYLISLVTTRTFDLIDVLQRLLLESTKKIEIKENETIDLAVNIEEDITVTDEWEVLTPTAPIVVEANGDDRGQYAGGVGDHTEIIPFTVPVGSNLLVVVFCRTVPVPSEVRYDGVAMTLAVNENDPRIYYLIDPSTGSNNLEVDINPGGADFLVTLHALSGMNTADILEGTATDSASPQFTQTIAQASRIESIMFMGAGLEDTSGGVGAFDPDDSRIVEVLDENAHTNGRYTTIYRIFKTPGDKTIGSTYDETATTDRGAVFALFNGNNPET